ncbi:MAG: glycosyltransferase [Candidatus Marithrix sp.]
MARILHIGKYFPPFAGGIENFLADLMSAQTKLGDDVAAIVHNHEPHIKFFQPIQAENNIYRTPSYGRVLYAPISPHFPFWLNHILKEFQPQILHLHLPNTSAFFALTLPRAKRIPWVIHWHSDVVSTVNKKLAVAYHVYRPFEQFLLKHSNTIIVTSPPYLESSIALQTWRYKCKVIPLGIDKTRLPELTINSWAEQQWQTDKIRFLSIGRLTYYKGHETLIKAVAKVDNAQVIIIGKGELRANLTKLITKLNLQHKVKLFGYCDNRQLIALLNSCDCFCLSSLERTEAFGVVLLEAMRYAKPIIVKEIVGSGVTWVVKNAGLVVSQSDLLTDALQKISDNKDLRKNLGQIGQKRFEQLFDIKNVAVEISKLYETILN